LTVQTNVGAMLVSLLGSRSGKLLPVPS